MASIANLSVRLTANISSFAAQMGAAAKPLMRFSNRVSAVGSSITGLVGGLSAVAAISAGVKLAADFEQAEVAMTTMLGSAEKAKVLLSDLTDFAAATPFEMTELVGAAKQLVAFGTKGEEVVGTLRMIGDVSAGIGAPIGDIAYLFGQIRSQGKAMTQDLNQFAGRGIPIYTALAKVLNTNEAGVREFASAGQISFAHIQQAFQHMTAEGGQFGGMMQRQSRTVAGLFSTMKDAVSISLRKIGQSLIENLDVRGRLASLTTAIEAYGQRIIPVVTAAARWIAANRQLVTTIAATGAATLAALIVLPRLVSTVSAVISVATAAGHALKFAFANPLLTIGIGAVAAFTAVLIRSIATNESWSESAYQMSRSIGLFRSATQDLGNLLADFGARRNEIQDVQAALRNTRDLSDRIEHTRELLLLLNQQLDAAKRIAKLQQQSGNDAGFSDKTLKGIRDQIKAAEAQLEAMQQAKANANAAKFALPTAPATAPAGAADAAKLAEDVQKLTDRLREQAATYGMAAHQAEIYKLAQGGATEAQLAAAVAAAQQIDAQRRQHEIRETIAALQEQAATFGKTTAQIELYKLAKQGASQADLAYAEQLTAQLEAMQKQQDLQERAKAVFDATRTPLENYEAKIGDLNEMLKAGLIAWDTYGRAVRDARAELERSNATDVTTPNAPNAFRVGSAEAQRFAFELSRGQQQMTRDDVPKKQLAEQQDTNRILERVERNTRGGAASDVQTIGID